jgi:hypothetical protein
MSNSVPHCRAIVLAARAAGLLAGCAAADVTPEPAPPLAELQEPALEQPLEPERAPAAGAQPERARCPEPTLVEPGKFSLPALQEYRLSFTPDGNTAFFARGEMLFPFSRQATIYLSRRQDGVWSEPEVAPFSGTYPDLDPVVSSDGTLLYLSSIRPVDGVERSDVDLWVVPIEGEGFGEPVNLGSDVNSLADELYPSVTVEGDVYFASDRADGLGSFDLWRTRRSRGATQPENLGPALNGPGLEFNPWISAHGELLLFTQLDGPDGYGSGDLYVSVDLGSGFRPARNLGPCVNSVHDEYHASPRLETGDLYFIRREVAPVEVPGEIYRLSMRAWLASFPGAADVLPAGLALGTE